MYRSFYNYWKNVHEDDIKNWELVESTYSKAGCVLFVATTTKEGKEVLAGALPQKCQLNFLAAMQTKIKFPKILMKLE